MTELIKACLTLMIVFTTNTLFASDLKSDKKLVYAINHCYVFMIDSVNNGMTDAIIYDDDKYTYQRAKSRVDQHIKERYSKKDAERMMASGIANAVALRDQHRLDAENQYSKWLFWGRQEKVEKLLKHKLYKEIDDCRHNLNLIANADTLD